MMRTSKLLVLCVASLALFGLPAMASAVAGFVQKLDAGQPQTIVVYGTSLTAGGGAGGWRWPTQLKILLDERKAANPSMGVATIINSGQSGKASNTGVSLLQAAVLDKNPDVVFIEFGTNDAFTAYAADHVDFNITLAKSKANLNAMIDSIQAGHPEREVILQTMNPAYDAANGNGSGSKRADLSAYFQGYRDVAAERGLLLVDHHASWVALQQSDLPTFKTYIADGVHPNDAGYAATVRPGLAAAVLPEPSAALSVLAVVAAGIIRRRGR